MLFLYICSSHFNILVRAMFIGSSENRWQSCPGKFWSNNGTIETSFFRLFKLHLKNSYFFEFTF